MSTFDFNIAGYTSPFVTLTANGLSFNHSFIANLGFPSRICIGIDREGKRVAFRAAPEGACSVPTYPFVTDEKKKKRVTVTASILRKEISKLLTADSGRKGLKFMAVMDPNEKQLVIDLNNAIE